MFYIKIRKKILILILLTSHQFGYSQNKNDFKLSLFNKFPLQRIELPNNLFIDKIIPSKKYKYMEFVYHSEGTYRGKTIAYKGDSIKYSNKISAIQSFSGFFNNCFPVICNYYIIAINENDSIELIDNEEKFKAFIGSIDNNEEIKLIVKLNKYWFDKKKKRGAIREIDDSFYLYLAYEERCTIYSIKAILKKTGEFILVDKKVNKKTKPCITH